MGSKTRGPVNEMPQTENVRSEQEAAAAAGKLAGHGRIDGEMVPTQIELCESRQAEKRFRNGSEAVPSQVEAREVAKIAH